MANETTITIIGNLTSECLVVVADPWAGNVRNEQPF